jgi:hypothetical protein
MVGAWVPLVIVGPLGFTLWVLVVSAAAILVVMAIGVLRHLESVRADQRRERVRAELGPMLSRFRETEDPTHLTEELHTVVSHMDAAHRAVGAMLAIDLVREAPSRTQTEALRRVFEETGVVELGCRGTHRLSPWRRVLACDLLGALGTRGGVPALLERLEDRRPEVRMSAVQALGEIGSAEAVPALSAAFLERRVAPTSVVNDALRRIGGESAPAFERGVDSPDPIVRVSSCFGLAAIASTHGAAVYRLAEVLESDSDARVRAAAASALGLAGGGNAPAALVAATTDPEVQVRRSAVKALGFFDDPTSCDTLDEHTEDEDRETAIRSAESLFALARRPHAAPEARTVLESSAAWSVEYVRTVAAVSATA